MININLLYQHQQAYQPSSTHNVIKKTRYEASQSVVSRVILYMPACLLSCVEWGGL